MKVGTGSTSEIRVLVTMNSNPSMPANPEV
jgi:hypothetical protein